MALETILGAGGSVGVPLAKELTKYTDKIRLVGRKPKKINETDELVEADLKDFSKIDAAVAGSAIVYVTIGFEYDIKVWRAVWPPFVKAVIDACEKHGAKLVFFDNMYMYDHAYLANMTEDTPMNPKTKKGVVRKQLADMIWDAVKAGRIQAIIARAADFIGPKNSVFVLSVLNNFKQGKKADWLITDKALHNFTFVDDAAKAVAMLAHEEDTWNQVWHMPSTTAKTGKEWIELAAQVAGTEPKYRLAPKWLLAIMGWFNPLFREIGEMSYQNASDYYLNSDKFCKRFHFETTAPEEAVKRVYNAL